MLGRHLRPPSLLPIVSIYITWYIVIPTAVRPLPFVSYIQYSLLSPIPYICFSGSLHILFSLNFRNVLCYRGLYSSYSIPMLYIWIGYIPIISSSNIILGVNYSYRVLCYI